MKRRFVIQFHSTCGGSHYDLMLEAGAALATWQLERLPAGLAAGQVLPARRLADHRLRYLTYEGPISGGRGCVRIADSGQYRTISRSDREWTFQLFGQKLTGLFGLRRVRGECWRLTAAGPPKRSEA